MTAKEIASDIIGYSVRLWEEFTFTGLILGGREFIADLELSAQWRSQYELTGDDIKSIEQMITFVWNTGTPDGRYEGLIDSFQQNVDYNFVRDEICGNLFLFHHACSRVDGKDFVKDVIMHCLAGGEVGLDKLMQLRDFQGRTPLHVAVAVAPDKGRDDVLWSLFGHLEPEFQPKFESVLAGYEWNVPASWLREFHVFPKVLGVQDGRGWTPLHLVATQPSSLAFETLFFLGGANGSGIEEYCTSLHLAILYNNIEVFQIIKLRHIILYDHISSQHKLRTRADNWCDMISRRILCSTHESEIGGWSVLALALLLGNQDIVNILLSEKNVTKNEVRILFQ